MRGENTPIEHPQREETGKIPQTPEELLEQTQALLSDFQRKSEEVVEEAGADQSVDVKKPLASPAPTSRRSFLKGLGVGVGFAVVGTSARVAREGSYEKPQDAREGSALPSLEEILEDPSCAEQLSTDQMDTLAVLLDSAREKRRWRIFFRGRLSQTSTSRLQARNLKNGSIEMIAGTTALMTLSGFLTATEKAFGSADISELRSAKRSRRRK